MTKDNKTNSFTIPWYVLSESIRLYLQLIQYLIDEGNNLDELSSSQELGETLLYYNEKIGPILKDIGCKHLPPLFSNCQSEKDVRLMNVKIQQVLISL